MDKLLQLLGLAMRANRVVTGTEAVLRAIRSGEARLVLVAEDASRGALKRVRDKCSFYSVPLICYGTRVALGRAIGKDRKSTRLNSSHVKISYAVFCLKKKNYI